METEQKSQTLTPNAPGASIVQIAPAESSDDGDSASNKGLNLKALGRTIQRQALLIAGVATLVAVGASYLAMREQSLYMGDFQILVEPVTNEARITDPLSVTRAPGGVPSRDTFTLDYATQLQILQSPEMLESISQEVRTQYPDFSIAELRSGLTVERLAPEGSPDPTRIIQVTYAGSIPERVQKVLSVTADQYLEYSLQDRKTRFGEGIKFIDDQLPEVQQRVSRIQDDLQQLQQQSALIDPAIQGGQLSEQINVITTQQLETQRELEEQRVLFDNLQRQLELSPEEAIAASALSEDPTYIGLQAQLAEIDSQLAIERARFRDASPTVEALQQRRDNLAALLDQQAQSVIGQSIGGATGNPQIQAFQNSVRLDLIGQLVTARNQIQVLEVREREVDTARRQFEERIRAFPETSRQYAELTRELEIATQTLDRLQTQRETLRVEAAQTEIPWELISQPIIPRDAQGNPLAEPSKASRTVMAGAAAGLVLGVLLALLLERYRNVFYTVEDVQEGVPLPLVGVIPFSRGAKQSFDFPSTFSAEDIDDSRLGTASFREAFSDLYSNIRLAEPPVRALMVCSAEPGDGKTTIALYLAQTAAGSGQKVLLVDTNLRLPQIHSRLDLPNTKGLSGLLTTGQNPNELIQPTSLSENLFVLTSGPSTPGSARLLGSDRMKQIMEKFKSEFDLIIYDTPHLFGLTDASFLTTQVDEILMVISANKTNRSVVDRVLNKLMTLRSSGISVVTNYLRENNSPNGSYSRYSQSIRAGRETPSGRF
ncbi:MAG: polysaccharide biosynthesis tyrosine autokinase [Cyanobacteria bacterium CRU_2_1]|nr:polysaccharide biosynthesis tyrosine autokinase [Cyanobacteria bacterium RU_5_0]NJR60251.1 polysaccharide biosynthesis tyrosine autokinase [Cyanobacteria bacterium CRU_2_1]